MFLHINYNTFRISFWILYYILSNKDASMALKKEMDDLVEDKLNEEDNTIDLTVEDLDDMEMLGSFSKTIHYPYPLSLSLTHLFYSS